MEPIIGLIMLVLGVAVLFAQLRLFKISDTLDKVQTELMLLRQQHLFETGRITEDEFRERVNTVINR